MIKEKERNCFEDDVFEADKLQTKEYLDLVAIYDSYPMYVPEIGNVVSGVYQGVRSGQHVFSASGYKDDVHVDDKMSEARYLKDVEKGEYVDILITHVDNTNFFIKGSVSDLVETAARRQLASLDKKTPVLAKVKSLNPAGYEVEVEFNNVLLSGFMPNTLAGINKLYDPESILGITFDVIIESFSQNEGTYIVSRKKYLQSLIPDEVKLLNYDEIYTGYVTGTTLFGVFVEFHDCLTGMIHKANLSKEWQDKIGDIKPGFEMEFFIKEIIRDRDRYKIILTQILRETLWDTVKGGNIITGKVKDTKRFGTLVYLDEETVGLIHTSEMNKIDKTYKPGDDVRVKVLSVDRSSRKIFLTPAE